MSTRDTILANLETVLKAITMDNGYKTNIKTVTREPKNIKMWGGGDKPAVWIADTEPDKYKGRVGTDHWREMHLTLACMVETADDLNTEFNNFLADIHQCIHTARLAGSLGTNVLQIILEDVMPVVGEKEIAFAQDIIITYYYPC